MANRAGASQPRGKAPRKPTHDFLAGGGEMGALMRAMDWSKTPLGPVERWPQSLRSPVSILLPSRAQIVLFWGPDLIALYNDAYRPVLGAKHPRVLGLPAREVFSEIWDSVLGGLFQGVLRTGEAFWGRDLPFVLERHGGPEETFFDVSYDPVRDESGAVGGIFCIVSETTGRVVGERRLGILRGLATRNAAARTPREACALAMESLAASPQEVPFALVHLDNELQACTPGAEALAAASPALVNEVPIPAAGVGGRAGVLRVGLNPLRPYDEHYRGFLELLARELATGIAHARAYEDERKRAEELAELDRAKTAFFSNVSHEFRTPLTLMLGPLEDLLKAGDDLEPETRASLQVVQRNSQRLLRLVNTLLDFARIEAGRAQAAYRPTDLAMMTADLASNFRSACERAGLRLEVDCAPLAEPAWVDREMWEKIVLNLLSNAFKFTLQGGITVRLRDAGAHLELVVKDTGAGIPAEALPRMFERFHRVEATRGRSYEGSGIGLALVNELVRLHGGSIGVESRPGEGAAFTVTIPKGSAHLPAERVKPAHKAGVAAASRAGAYVAEALGWLPEAPAAEAQAYPAGTPRILLADDNADLREYVGRLLAERYEVQAVADGEAALAAADARAPDLVISDVMMPRLDGFGLIRELRADPALRAVPVILLSARAGEEARVEGLGRGADDYLVKPFSSRELLARVEALLASSTAQRRETESLREAAVRKDEFLATLSHELRNPLAPLRNALQLMRLTGGAGADAANARDIMERQVDHLSRLVDDLLEMSRISRGAFELRREPVALAAVVRNAVETSEPLIREARHRLDVSLPGEALWLEGDPVRLAQILSNLLNNAARYTPEGGAIVLSARREGATVLVSVRDNGSGISAQALPRIFEMFHREVRADARGQGGLGIGLTLSRRLAEMHGGGIEAHSAGAGRGSEFILRLPVAAPPRKAQALQPQPAALRSMRILVVDDNRDAASSLGMVLRVLGAEVRVAHDGPEALEAYGASDPAVVLLDIGMPGMDGFEVARTLRARFPGRRATLVALTGWGQEEDRQRAREAGFDHHLVKPAEIDSLQQLLADIDLGRRGPGGAA